MNMGATFGTSPFSFTASNTMLTAAPSSDYGTGAMLSRSYGTQSLPSGYGTGAMLTDPSKLPSWYGTGELLQAPKADNNFPSTLSTAGLMIDVFGAVNGAIGAYFAAESQKNTLKMQAQNQKFASQMAALNAKGAEFAAQAGMEMGERAIGRYTMAAGQARASAAASLAARGVQAGYGSAAEIIGSMDVIKEIDRLTMSANNVRQAEAMRMQAVNYTTQSRMEGLSAQNLMTTAGSLNAGLSAYGSLLGSASDIGASWLRSKRFEELLGGVSTKRF